MERFNIPVSFWSPMEQEASGYINTYNESDSHGKLRSYSASIRFLIKETTRKPLVCQSQYSYIWYKLGFATYWTPSQSVLLCFSLPAELQESVIAAMVPLRAIESSPFALMAVVLEEILDMYDKAVWTWRKRVREIEQVGN
jgi:hypothetical protein